MIFPGMDPWVEHPAYWPGFHNWLVTYFAEQLNQVIRPKYVARLQTRIYIDTPADPGSIPDVVVERTKQPWPRPASGAVATLAPDAAVSVTIPGWEANESVIAIVDRANDFKIVTWIEVTSLSNKYSGEGRTQCLDKQREILSGDAHLVEIDLLRAGPHVLAVPEWAVRSRYAFDYLVSVNRAAGRRQTFQLYPKTVRDRLPVIGVPLANGDADTPIDLQALVARTYDATGYIDVIDYTKPSIPRLSAKDRAWANGILKAAGLK